LIIIEFYIFAAIKKKQMRIFKYIIFLILIQAISINMLNAQNQYTQSFILSNAFEFNGYTAVYTGLNTSKIGPGYISYGGGLRRITRIQDNWGIGIGLDYTSQVFKCDYINPATKQQEIIQINNNSILSIPIYFKFLFAEKFYISPEFFFDYQLKDFVYYENQSGISAGLNFGRYFFLDRNVWMYIQAEGRVTSLVAFNTNHPEMLIAPGLRLGIYYSNLKKR